ncbi:hypothetical protein V6N13_037746 [Hibiscus sabdariffa]|uniref:Uncharacterized protein n=1 Tax=Hibiscus sabdariffa TaxID=183260 RepID=A0ABR2S466_9ROSI
MWLWKGFLFGLSVWDDHQENILHDLLRFIDVKVLLSPRFVIRVRSSCPFGLNWNVDVNSKGFVNFLKACVN